MKPFPPLRIYITGVPATGKTSIAKELSQQLSLCYFEINDIVIEHNFTLGYDINRDTLIIDDELIIPHLESLFNKHERICLVGSLFPLKTKVDIIFIIHCAIPVLRQRLRERNYSDEKIEANVEAEIMNLIYYDASEFFPQRIIYEITNNFDTVNKTCDQIILIIQEHFLRDNV